MKFSAKGAIFAKTNCDHIFRWEILPSSCLPSIVGRIFMRLQRVDWDVCSVTGDSIVHTLCLMDKIKGFFLPNY